VLRGFERAASGAITRFEAPGAETSADRGTTALGINMAGDIAGYYVDSADVYHGFVRTRR
jgi:hypothetical protein